MITINILSNFIILEFGGFIEENVELIKKEKEDIYFYKDFSQKIICFYSENNLLKDNFDSFFLGYLKKYHDFKLFYIYENDENKKNQILFLRIDDISHKTIYWKSYIETDLLKKESEIIKKIIFHPKYITTLNLFLKEKINIYIDDLLNETFLSKHCQLLIFKKEDFNNYGQNIFFTKEMQIMISLEELSEIFKKQTKENKSLLSWGETTVGIEEYKKQPELYYGADRVKALHDFEYHFNEISIFSKIILFVFLNNLLIEKEKKFLKNNFDLELFDLESFKLNIKEEEDGIFADIKFYFLYKFLEVSYERNY